MCSAWSGSPWRSSPSSAATFEGGHAGALLNGPAALIVIGGTLAAALLQTPVNVLKRGLGMLGWVFFPPREDLSGESTGSSPGA